MSNSLPSKTRTSNNRVLYFSFHIILRSLGLINIKYHHGVLLQTVKYVFTELKFGNWDNFWENSTLIWCSNKLKMFTQCFVPVHQRSVCVVLNCICFLSTNLHLLWLAVRLKLKGLIDYSSHKYNFILFSRPARISLHNLLHPFFITAVSVSYDKLLLVGLRN